MNVPTATGWHQCTEPSTRLLCAPRSPSCGSGMHRQQREAMVPSRTPRDTEFPTGASKNHTQHSVQWHYCAGPMACHARHTHTTLTCVSAHPTRGNVDTRRMDTQHDQTRVMQARAASACRGHMHAYAQMIHGLYPRGGMVPWQAAVGTAVHVWNACTGGSHARMVLFRSRRTEIQDVRPDRMHARMHGRMINVHSSHKEDLAKRPTGSYQSVSVGRCPRTVIQLLLVYGEKRRESARCASARVWIFLSKLQRPTGRQRADDVTPPESGVSSQTQPHGYVVPAP